MAQQTQPTQPDQPVPWPDQLKGLLSILVDATKQYRPLKYAWGVLGIATVAAIITLFMLPARTAIIGGFVVFLGMILLVVFGTAVSLPNHRKSLQAQAILWIGVAAFAVLCGTGVSSVCFGVPQQMAQFLGVMAAVPPDPTVTFTGTPLNETQKRSLDTLGVVLKEPDDVFNAKAHDYENRPIDNWICKFESVDPKPTSPKEGRKFTVAVDNRFKAVCLLKPGVAGDELTIAHAWSRKVTRGLFADEKNETISTKGMFVLLNCELKMPL